MVLMPLIIPFGNLRLFCAEDEESGHHSLTHSLTPSRTELELAVDTKFKLFPQKTRSTPGGKHAID